MKEREKLEKLFALMTEMRIGFEMNGRVEVTIDGKDAGFLCDFEDPTEEVLDLPPALEWALSEWGA